MIHLWLLRGWLVRMCGFGLGALGVSVSINALGMMPSDLQIPSQTQKKKHQA